MILRILSLTLKRINSFPRRQHVNPRLLHKIKLLRFHIFRSSQEMLPNIPASQSPLRRHNRLARRLNRAQATRLIKIIIKRNDRRLQVRVRRQAKRRSRIKQKRRDIQIIDILSNLACRITKTLLCSFIKIFLALNPTNLAFEIQHTKITFFAVAWQVIFLFFIHFNLLSVLVLRGKYYYLLGFQLGVFRCVLLGLCL